MSNENKLFDLMEKMYMELQETRSEMKEMKTDVKDVKGRVINIENDQGKKIDALFDAREVTNDKLDDIDEKIDKVQFDVNNLTMKVAQNDNTIIDLKRNLKNVK